MEVTTVVQWWCRGRMCIFGGATMTGDAMCMFTASVDFKAVRWRTLVAAAK
jgi:hypothetical protein